MLNHKGISEVVRGRGLNVSSFVVLVLLFLSSVLLLLLRDLVGKVEIPVSLAFVRRLARGATERGLIFGIHG